MDFLQLLMHKLDKINDEVCIGVYICVCVCVCVYIYMYICIWRGKWQPTPLLLPRESHGQKSLVGCSP